MDYQVAWSVRKESSTSPTAAAAPTDEQEFQGISDGVQALCFIFQTMYR